MKETTFTLPILRNLFIYIINASTTFIFSSFLLC